MSTDMIYRIESDSSETTELLAERLGSKLRGGEVIVLTSDLGGGKTTFVRGLARGIGSRDHVASPTFTVGRQYYSDGKGLLLHHFDFYRLQEPGIIAHELADALNDEHAVTVIEWGDIVSSVLPDKKIVISITCTSESSRVFTVTCPPSMEYLVSESERISL